MQDYNGKTLLNITVLNSNTATITLLIQYAAQINKTENTIDFVENLAIKKVTTILKEARQKRVLHPYVHHTCIYDSIT